MSKMPFTHNLVMSSDVLGDSRVYDPPKLPPRWTRHAMLGATGFTHKSGLKVICSVSLERDGQDWLHVSVSRPDQLPSWDDLKNVKNIFCGRDGKAILVFPPQAEYVNLNPYVHHLWMPLEKDPLPDFRKGGVI